MRLKLFFLFFGIVAFSLTAYLVRNQAPEIAETHHTGSCKSLLTEVPIHGKLIFKSGFELPERLHIRQEESAAEGLSLTDVDSGYSWGVPWEDPSGSVYIASTDTAGINQYPFQIVDLIIDPDDADNIILHTSNVSDVQPAQKNQARTAIRLKPDNSNPLTKQLYARYRMKLDPSLEKIPPDSSDKWRWFNIIEIKEVQDHPFFFTGVNLIKKEGKPITWNIEGRKKKNSFDAWETIWEENNYDVPIPYGEWFEVEYFIRRGKNTGRIFFAITKDDKRQVVFDFNLSNPTSVPSGFTTSLPSDNKCSDLETFEFMKTYVGPPYDVREIIGEPIDSWYDDLEVWTGLPPNYE